SGSNKNNYRVHSSPALEMATSSDMSLASIPTPPHCTADFCLIPIGTSSPSVSAQIADVQRLVEQCGLKYVMHSAGTTLGMYFVDGRNPILTLHPQQTDKVQSFEDKVNKVRELLGK
ncbi:hypothetical protein AOCH_003828, partial [Aspergillus ochraceoroseus]